MVRPRKALRIITVLATLLVSLAFTGPACADLINGDFEATEYAERAWAIPSGYWDEDISDPTGGQYNRRDLTVTSEENEEPYVTVVQFTGHEVILQESPDWTRFDARYLDPGSPTGYSEPVSYTGIEQVFSMEQNAALLEFDFLMYGGGPESDFFEVELRGRSTPYYYQEIVTSSSESDAEREARYALTPDNFLRASISLPELAPGDYTLMFRLVGEYDGPDIDRAEVVIDNVGFSVVPAPGAMLLGSIGLGYAGLRLRRRSGEGA